MNKLFSHKIAALAGIVLASALFLTACGGTTTTTSAGNTTGGTTVGVTSSETAGGETTVAAGNLELTLAQLAEFNGKDGKRAYVALDGVIYDVTDNAGWKNGEHYGELAGTDISDAFKNKSPHDSSILSGLPVVGKLVQ